MSAPMELPPITILYTVGLRGELRILPYLFTLIRAQMAAAPGPTVLADLGESCRMDWPICAATEGRAALVALDGMGYDAFCLGPDEPLAADLATQAKLRETVLTAVLTTGQSRDLRKKIGGPAPDPADSEVPKRYLAVRCVGGEPDADTDPDDDPALIPDPADAARTIPLALRIHLLRGLPLATRVIGRRAVMIEDRREDRIPSLGQVVIRFDSFGEAVVAEQRRIAIPAGTRPEPSLSSLIEFIESEAEWTARRKS